MHFWWSIVVLSALVFGLAGCDSPSPAFARLPAQQVSVDGLVFSVRANAERAEALRISRGWRARRAVVVAKGGEAIALATGCIVEQGSLEGDTNIVRARINCSGVPP